ncbi:hypothetical protein [Alicyclobacillus dauci]|uniref:FlgN protein n=1 Tax=Alicyclobacillus dauci TaxID=1475485 RepID=A0ABY6Z4J6_9BACL|nr:hypothetical protein [Alicyclobacillus dauci]WAH37689.1 hypothetical protein NZD86_04030 [Alicyclobacillus dauci]
MNESITALVEEMLQIGNQALDSLEDPSLPFSNVEGLLNKRQRCFETLEDVIAGAERPLGSKLEWIRSSLSSIFEQNQRILEVVKSRQSGVGTSLRSIRGIERFIARALSTSTSGRQINVVL